MKMRMFVLILAAAVMIAPSAALAQVAPSPTPPPAPQLPEVPAVAPGYEAPALPLAPAQIVGITQQPFVGIALSDAVAMALAKNPDLAVAQGNRRIAGDDIVAASGAYDIRFSIVPSVAHNTTPPQNAFFAGPNFGAIAINQQTVGGGVSGEIPTGGQYKVSLSASKIDDNTVINTFNPYYPSVFSAVVTQPLGKNAGLDAAKRTVELARISADTSDAQALENASSTISEVENAYWDLVAAWRNVAIQEDALKAAVAQQNSNLRLYRSGQAAAIDAVESSTQVDVFQSNVYAALQNVAGLQNRLKALLTSDSADPIWPANLVPTTPALQLPAAPTLEHLVQSALSQRPEVQELRDLRRSADVNVAYARNQLRPQVDAQVAYMSNGLAGSVVPFAQQGFLASSAQQTIALNELIAAFNRGVPPNQQIPPLPNTTAPVPPYLSGGLGQSLANLFAGKFPSYQAGITISIPIDNRTARGDQRAADTQERIAAIRESALLERIAYEARNALQAYHAALARLSAAHAARTASEQVLASEQRKFRNGSSTTFLVLQRQVQVAQNRGLELQAQTDLNKAVVEIQRVSGDIISSNHVTLESLGTQTLGK